MILQLFKGRSVFLVIVYSSIFTTIAFSSIGQQKKQNKKDIKQVAVDWMNKGTDLAKDGKYTQAIVCYNKSIKYNPNNYEPWYNRGFCKVKLKHYETAIPDFTLAIKIHKEAPFPDGLYYRGYCYNQTGQYKLAISDLNKALETTSNEDIWAARAFAYFQTGDFQNALSDYTTAIANNKNKIEYFGLRALCQYNLHYLKETIADAETFLAIKPESPDIIEIELKAKIELAEYEGALTLAGHLIDQKKTPLTYYYKGFSEYYLQKYDDGIKDFTSALAIDSNYRDAYYCRALCYLGNNDDAHACPDLFKASSLGFPGIKGKIDAYCKDFQH